LTNIHTFDNIGTYQTGDDEMKIKQINFKSGTRGYALEIGKLGVFIGNNGFAIDYIGGFHYEFYKA
jgi:hypothetical protein